jgi:lactoylglutathione lyase
VSGTTGTYSSTPTTLTANSGYSYKAYATNSKGTSSGSVETFTRGRNFGHVAYRVENIYETCQKLMDAGVDINRPPRDGHMAFVKTPDGISIELLQRGESLAPAEPWASLPNTGSW